jgi:hypothetical protein
VWPNEPQGALLGFRKCEGKEDARRCDTASGNRRARLGQLLGYAVLVCSESSCELSRSGTDMPSPRRPSPRELRSRNPVVRPKWRYQRIAAGISCVFAVVTFAGLYFLLAPQSASFASQAAPGDASTYDPLQLSPQNAGATWSFESKGESNRFEVRAGDHMSGDGTEPKERSEAFSFMKLDTHVPYKISFGMEIEPGEPNSAKWLLLSQIQSTFDKSEAGHSPPFALGLKGEHMQIDSRFSPAQISTPADTNYMQLYSDPEPIERGHWYRVVIFVTFDPFGLGSLKVLRDGAQIVDYKGAIGFNDTVGAYFKEGVYRASAPETTVAQFKNLSIERLGN